MNEHTIERSLRAFACLNHETQRKRFTISPDLKYTKFEFEGVEEE